jgi:anti-anti-sigma factor
MMTHTRHVTSACAHCAVVSLPAEIDITNAAGAGTKLAAALAPGITVVVADMTATTFCDSSGVRMLVRAGEQAAAHGAELRLAVPSPAVQRTFTLIGVHSLLPVYTSLADALHPPAA